MELLEDDKIYYKHDLQEYLKIRGLPYSYPTILRYERLGVIPSPRRKVDDFTNRWRVYTGLEIKQIAHILSERTYETAGTKTKRKQA